MSIVSSVSAVIEVSASASRINSVPFKSILALAVTTPDAVSATTVVVPAMSAIPLMSKLPASNSPVSVMLRNDAMSLSADATTVLLATTVPAVAVSLKFSSAAVVVTAVPPIINLSLTISTSAPPAVSNLSADWSHIK